MLLHEIIKINDKGTLSILTETLYKYKKSLYTYYKDMFCGEPILMVTSVFNAAQYAIIVPSNEFTDAIDTYLQSEELSEEERQNEVELISYQSIMLKDF
tara:strand:+ start:719 stop:1015 length:297 start_codon:yes stop_codon:yes gene_type:complete